jgi:hypothetical protein
MKRRLLYVEEVKWELLDETAVVGEKYSQYYFVHRRSHMT